MLLTEILSHQQAVSAHELVSIVVPTYNRAHLLPKTLRSCLQQTYQNLEVIVVDDGSSDNTGDVVSDFQRNDGRVRYVRQQNQKLPTALNTGFRLSRGQYLTWISDDNQFREDAIQILVEAMSRDRDAGLVYSDFDIVDANGRFLRHRRLRGPERIPYQNCVEACFMYRREVYQKIGEYDPDLLLVEDYDYWLRIHLRFKVVHLSEVFPFSFAVHEQSLTTKRFIEVQHAVGRLRLRYVRLCLQEAHTWRKKLAIFSSSRPEIAEAYVRLGRPGRATWAAAQHVLFQPWRQYRWVKLLRTWQAAREARKNRLDWYLDRYS